MMPLACKTIIFHLLGAIWMTTFIAPVICCASQGYVVKEAHYIPQNEQEYWELTEDIKCFPSNLKVTYLISTWKNKTFIGCFPDVKIYGGFCAELNNGSVLRVQPNHDAPCHNFTRTPCKLLYYSSESYLIRQCFEKYGNISPPWEISAQNENLRWIVNDKKRVIQEQNHSLSEQIRENVKLMKIIQELNLTNMKLMKKVNENDQNNAAVQTLYFLPSLAILVIPVLGHFILFILHKYMFRDVTTFIKFCCWRWILVKAWFLTSRCQKQLLSPFVLATNDDSEQEKLREDRNNKNTSESLRNNPYGSCKRNEIENVKKDEEGSKDYHHEEEFSPEERDQLCENVKHIERNDDEQEIRQSETEGEGAIHVTLHESHRRVWD